MGEYWPYVCLSVTAKLFNHITSADLTSNMSCRHTHSSRGGLKLGFSICKCRHRTKSTKVDNSGRGHNFNGNKIE